MGRTWQSLSGFVGQLAGAMGGGGSLGERRRRPQRYAGLNVAALESRVLLDGVMPPATPLLPGETMTPGSPPPVTPPPPVTLVTPASPPNPTPPPVPPSPTIGPAQPGYTITSPLYDQNSVLI